MKNSETLNQSEAENAVLPFGNTLIAGAGPAAIHVAVNLARGWSADIGLVNRASSHSARLRQALEDNQYTLTSKVQNTRFGHLAGTVKIKCFYEGYDNIDDNWQTIILCTPSDSYMDVIQQLRPDQLSKVKTIILLSPGIGSNILVNSQLKSAADRIEVVSCSTYYAATKFDMGPRGILTACTKAFKKHIYIASSKANGTAGAAVKAFYENLGIRCTIADNPLDAECRSITTYVHPPFFISDFSLHEIFSSTPSRKYMYKLYPEGPITQHTIRSMLVLWREISQFIQIFGGKPVNLLKFLNDDNYPVHETTLSREDIETFTEVDPIKQEYLLYIRYSSILIDPFSIPDEQGKYFDFSAVPYKQVYKDENGKWVLPRIPFEDYKKLKLLYSLAQARSVPMPHTLSLITLFEQHLDQFVQKNGKEAFYPQELADTTPLAFEVIMNETPITSA